MIHIFLYEGWSLKQAVIYYQIYYAEALKRFCKTFGFKENDPKVICIACEIDPLDPENIRSYTIIRDKVFESNTENIKKEY